MGDRKRGSVYLMLLMWGAVLTVFSVPGCSEDPTEQNSLTTSLPLTELDVRDTVLVATGGPTTKQFIPLNGSVNLLGRSGAYESYLSIEFYPSLFPAIDTILVVSAKLTLRAVSWF